MTEDEARKKVCPIMYNGYMSYSGSEDWDLSVCNCLGSKCMMWNPPKEEIKESEDGTGNYLHITGGDCGLKND